MKKLEIILIGACILAVVITFMNYGWSHLTLIAAFMALGSYYAMGKFVVPFHILYRKRKNRGDSAKIRDAVSDIQFFSGLVLAGGVASLGFTIDRHDWESDIYDWTLICHIVMIIACVIVFCIKLRPAGLWPTFIRLVAMSVLMIFVQTQSIQIEAFEYGRLRKLFLTIYYYKDNPDNFKAWDDIQLIRDHHKTFQRLIEDPDLSPQKALMLEDVYDFYNVDYPGRSIRRYPTQ